MSDLLSSYFPLLYIYPFIIHCGTHLIYFMFLSAVLCFFFISPPRSNLMSIMFFSLCSLVAMILHLPPSAQYELLICQVVERHSGGRLRHRPDPSVWGSDGNSACWSQRPRSLDLLTGHCSFFWTGELYKANGSDKTDSLLCWRLSFEVSNIPLVKYD